MHTKFSGDFLSMSISEALSQVIENIKTDCKHREYKGVDFTHLVHRLVNHPLCTIKGEELLD
jgi:hypothetical protein